MKWISLLVCVVQATSALNYVDLGYSLNENSMAWPIQSPRAIDFKLDTVIESTEFVTKWLAGKKFCSPEHISTHIDAPFHFHKQGWTIDQIPLDRLIGNGVVMDISEKVKTNPNAQLMVEDIKKWTEMHGPIPNNSIILLRTDWSDKYGNQKVYFGYEDDIEVKAFPSYSEEAAKYFISLLDIGIQIYAMGVDSPSTDVGFNSRKIPVHRLMHANNIYGIENVKSLKNMPPNNFKLMVFPLHLKNGTGAPCRLVAHIDSVLNSDATYPQIFIFLYILTVLQL